MTTRRDFLKTGSAAALLVGFRLEGRPAEPADPQAFEPNAWIRITRDGRARLTVGKTEMGQGVRTSLPAILAEELDLDWTRIDLEQARPGPAFTRLGTGGSTSVTTSFTPLRQAAAAARQMLVAAAATRWNVGPAECRTESGFVIHQGRKLGYGALVAEAATLPVPKDPPLKKSSDFRLLGRDLGRRDAPDFVAGKAVYGQDLSIPGALVAMVARPPVVGGRALSWNEPAAKGCPGVRAVVPISTGVAVLADRTDQALEAVRALDVKWDLGPHAAFSSEAYRGLLEGLLDTDCPAQRREGDAPGALKTAPKVVQALYEFPFQSHATLETPACVAQVGPDSCELWAGSQSPNAAQAKVAAKLGLRPEQVTLHVALVGGGFGRRLSSEFIVEAAELAKAHGAPVKLVWSRADDFQHERYHPMSLHRLRGALDADGKPLSWHHRIAAPSIALSWAEGVRSPGQAFSETSGAYDIPYAFPHLLTDYAEAPCHLPLGWWRAIQVMPNIFARECFTDELAHAAGKDPLAFRLELLGQPRTFKAATTEVDTGRLAAVLKLAAEKAGWGGPLPKGRGRGIACLIEGNTCLAEVAEVSVTADGKYRVHRVTAAVDCGLVLNPRSAAGQVEGGVAWALSALRAASSFKDGRIQQLDYAAFPVLPLSDMPAVDVHFVARDAHPTGMGEPPAPPCIPAVLNAIFAATGRRIRRLPLRPEDLKA
jgi:isoquinoline 1-oxidoreductase subunit beta